MIDPVDPYWPKDNDSTLFKFLFLQFPDERIDFLIKITTDRVAVQEIYYFEINWCPETNPKYEYGDEIILCWRLTNFGL